MRVRAPGPGGEVVEVVVTGAGRVHLAPIKVTSGVELFGTKSEFAQYLGVAKTQPGRWMSGAESPTSVTARLVLDIDYVWDRITADMAEEAAGIWLRSPNSYLGGAVPLEWIKANGPARVIEAFDAREAGSYP